MNSEFLQSEQGAAPQILTVAELNRQVARLLERSIPLVWVAGEISNLTRAASGHWYFSLKDREAQVRCVMFRGRNQLLDWDPREGDRIEARAVAGLYAARGEFQLTVETLRRAGAGALFEAFLRLKAKLDAEGLFDPARKRPLPAFPRTIGIITSPAAAALRDVVSTLSRRAPHVRIILYPAVVQGKEAPERLTEAVRIASQRALRLAETDLLLIVRGGGSIEDLWAFNDEGLARAICASPVPIVCGVGHETDFTIADFVADLRAPTPTAAAELATPDARLLATRLRQFDSAVRLALSRRMHNAEQALDELQRRLRSPSQRLLEGRSKLIALAAQLTRAEGSLLGREKSRLEFFLETLRRVRPDTQRKFDQLRSRSASLMQGMRLSTTRADARLELAHTRLALLNPLGLLDRGYAIVTDARGRVVQNAIQLAPQDRIAVRLAGGTAITDVVGIDLEQREAH
jgi:exodeoxyribonuclease VII large subunit